MGKNVPRPPHHNLGVREWNFIKIAVYIHSDLVSKRKPNPSYSTHMGERESTYYIITVAGNFAGENFRELVKVEHFANKTFADC